MIIFHIESDFNKVKAGDLMSQRNSPKNMRATMNSLFSQSSVEFPNKQNFSNL